MRAAVLVLGLALVAAATMGAVDLDAVPPRLAPSGNVAAMTAYQDAITVPVERAAAANASNANTGVSTPRGMITVVQPRLKSGTLPRGGGLFIEAYLIRGSNINDIVAVLWYGYLRSTRGKASIANVPCTIGHNVALRVSGGSTVTTSEVVQLNVTVETDPRYVPSGTYIHVEEQMTGRGVTRRIAVGDPAAGAEAADQPVPAQVAWRVKAVDAQLVTDATAASRQVGCVYRDSGSNRYMQASANAFQTASQTVNYRGVFGVGDGGAVNNLIVMMFSLADFILEAGEVFSPTSTSNLQAGDNWGAVVVTVEEWAVPP